MIKKYLLGLFVGFVCLISFGYGVDLDYVFQNGSYNTSPGDSTIDFAVYNRGMLSSTRLGNTKRMLAFRSYSSSSSKHFAYFFWYNSMPTFYFYNCGNSCNTNFRKATRYVLCPVALASNTTGLSNCTTDQLSDISSLYGFFNSIKSTDYWGYNLVSDNNYRVCFGSTQYSSTICFNSSTDYASSSGLAFSGNLDFISFPDRYLGDPPGWSTSGSGDDVITQGNGGIALDTEASAINYFETRYGWDSSICYVGVDNITSLYGQNGVSFQKGQGLSIFDVFNQLYGNTDINKVYVWLNTWLLNYEQWFYRDTPLYLANYNSGSNQVDLYYDNLSFPFANNPVALYFMASNISENSNGSTMGSEIVSYCNIKINDGTYDEIIDQSVKNNINTYTEKYNTNQGLNPDGSSKEYGAWLSSGVNIAFSGNTSIKNSLKNFFDTVNENINVSEGTSTLQILPTWLLSALMFVILFKFLRKR